MDPSSSRKKDHIELALRSRIESDRSDKRFYYEPLLATFPQDDDISLTFLSKSLKAPIWISSMTGGTGEAAHINENLARACGEFGLGMGLGSCRMLLDDDRYINDFRWRHLVGDQPLYANLGIAQINELIDNNRVKSIYELVSRLEADGLIIHVNPLQEWLQPEGDQITGRIPIETIEILLNTLTMPLIVKEVGQGMGPGSLEALMNLPVAAIEFAAFGGTNFARLESLRNFAEDDADPLCYVGHDIVEMISFVEEYKQRDYDECPDIILSGGIKNYLDGYYYNQLMPLQSVYGQASAFLSYARHSYDQLAGYVDQQINGYRFANKYLRVRNL